MPKVFRCLYCNNVCHIIEKDGKHFLDCKECGQRELTKLGKARMEGKAEDK